MSMRDGAAPGADPEADKQTERVHQPVQAVSTPASASALTTFSASWVNASSVSFSSLRVVSSSWTALSSPSSSAQVFRVPY